MGKSKALVAAEAKIEELEAAAEVLRESVKRTAELDEAKAENLTVELAERVAGDWNTCSCVTCATIRAHQADTETIDEILVLAGR